MKLILINGQEGSGKTSVGKLLLHKLKNSAFIDVDSLVTTNPWKFGSETDNLAIQNSIGLINNFSEAGFSNIIVSGLTRNQQLLDSFLLQLNRKVEILFIWLRANEDVRMLRKKDRGRDGADQAEHFNFVDTLYPDIDCIDVKNGKTIFVDTSGKNIEKIVDQIILDI